MTTAQIVCSIFLEQCTPQKRDQLLSYLNPVQKEKIVKRLGTSKQLPQKKDHFLHRIHPSWISPILRTLSQQEVGLMMMLLSPQQQTLIQKELFFSGEKIEPSARGRKFLERFLASKLQATEMRVCPFILLDNDPLLQIFDLTFEEVDLLVDLLAMYDLAFEMRLIIDKVRMKAIQMALSSKQRDFLQSLMQHQPAVSFGKMDLASWDMTKESLHKMLVQRGINRLVKGSGLMQSDFAWHLSHLLSLEKAKTFSKLAQSKTQDTQLCETLCDQIMEIIHYIKKKRS